MNQQEVLDILVPKELPKGIQKSFGNSFYRNDLFDEITENEDDGDGFGDGNNGDGDGNCAVNCIELYSGNGYGYGWQLT